MLCLCRYDETCPERGVSSPTSTVTSNLPNANPHCSYSLPGRAAPPAASLPRGRWQAAADGRRCQNPQADRLPDAPQRSRQAAQEDRRLSLLVRPLRLPGQDHAESAHRLLHVRAGTRPGVLQRDGQLHHRAIRRRQQGGRTAARRRHERRRLVVRRSAPPPLRPRPGTDHVGRRSARCPGDDLVERQERSQRQEPRRCPRIAW